MPSPWDSISLAIFRNGSNRCHFRLSFQRWDRLGTLHGVSLTEKLNHFRTTQNLSVSPRFQCNTRDLIQDRPARFRVEPHMTGSHGVGHPAVPRISDRLSPGRQSDPGSRSPIPGFQTKRGPRSAERPATAFRGNMRANPLRSKDRTHRIRPMYLARILRRL
jgi:hypothetical protein